MRSHFTQPYPAPYLVDILSPTKNPHIRADKQEKIVVIGGSGLIGTKLVNNLRQRGHEVLAASPNSGVNTITGEGLADALAGAQVAVDVANSPSFEDKAAMEFFDTSTRNLLAGEMAAGVGHHVALLVVGTERLVETDTSGPKWLKKT